MNPVTLFGKSTYKGKNPIIVFDSALYDPRKMDEIEQNDFTIVEIDGHPEYFKIWFDIKLATFLENITLTPCFEENTYYPDYYGVFGKSERFTKELYNSSFDNFRKGYLTGEEAYQSELLHWIKPLSENDQSKKITTLKLEQEVKRHIDFYLSGMPGQILNLYCLEDLGKIHGLYTVIRETITRHSWQVESVETSSFKKIVLTDNIKLSEITTYFLNLLEQKKINTEIANLERVLKSVFSKEGKNLSPHTLNTYLKKSKKDDFRSKK